MDLFLVENILFLTCLVVQYSCRGRRPLRDPLATLPPVIGLGFGAYSEWSSEVDKLIGQMAELGGQHPERFGCSMGANRLVGRWRCGPSDICTARLLVRRCGAAIRPLIASSFVRLRRSRAIQRSAVGRTVGLTSRASETSSSLRTIAPHSRGRSTGTPAVLRRRGFGPLCRVPPQNPMSFGPC